MREDAGASRPAFAGAGDEKWSRIIFIALVFDMSYYLVYWWLSLTILDLIAALYCIAVEKEEVRLVFYSLFYRLFFILMIDVTKTFATIEEFLGFGMNWGKLERIGTGAKQ